MIFFLVHMIYDLKCNVLLSFEDIIVACTMAKILDEKVKRIKIYTMNGYLYIENMILKALFIALLQQFIPCLSR